MMISFKNSFKNLDDWHVSNLRFRKMGVRGAEMEMGLKGPGK